MVRAYPNNHVLPVLTNHLRRLAGNLDEDIRVIVGVTLDRVDPRAVAQRAQGVRVALDTNDRVLGNVRRGGDDLAGGHVLRCENPPLALRSSHESDMRSAVGVSSDFQDLKAGRWDKKDNEKLTRSSYVLPASFGPRRWKSITK